MEIYDWLIKLFLQSSAESIRGANTPTIRINPPSTGARAQIHSAPPAWSKQPGEIETLLWRIWCSPGRKTKSKQIVFKPPLHSPTSEMAFWKNPAGRSTYTTWISAGKYADTFISTVFTDVQRSLRRSMIRLKPPSTSCNLQKADNNNN